MGSLRRYAALVVLGLLFALPAHAVPVYSTPSLSVVQASRASITVQVTAGQSGAPSGFTVEWMLKSDYDIYGWDPIYGEYYCYCWGAPTWNMGATFALQSNASHQIELGDTFDETGVTVDYSSELVPNTQYVFRSYVNSDPYWAASPYSSTVVGTTKAQTNCVFTQGYWKTHPEAWPVTSLTLGTVTYSQADLLSILGTPAGGNGLLILGHQLIATLLNVANGADPTPVATNIANAHALIGGLIMPPLTGAGFLAPALVNADATALDNYNNGNTTVPHCGETPAKVRTWGAVKSLYR